MRIMFVQTVHMGGKPRLEVFVRLLGKKTTVGLGEGQGWKWKVA